MMINLEQVDWANQVFRADKFVLNVPRQITAIEKSKSSVSQDHSETVCVVSLVFGDRLEVVATRFDLRGARSFTNDSLICGKNAKAKCRHKLVTQKFDLIACLKSQRLVF